jgi:hypothetical protein
MILLDVTAPLSIPLRFVAGILAGIAATFAMDLVMPRLPEGPTPPSIASGVLTETPPDDAPERLATVVHYIAGVLTGPLFVWLLFAVEGVLNGPSAGVTAITASVLYLLVLAPLVEFASRAL